MYSTNNVTFLDRIRHQLNPLHIYCRLTCYGISSKVSRDICKIYETGFYKLTLGKKGLAVLLNQASPLNKSK